MAICLDTRYKHIRVDRTNCKLKVMFKLKTFLTTQAFIDAVRGKLGIYHVHDDPRPQGLTTAKGHLQRPFSPSQQR